MTPTTEQRKKYKYAFGSAGMYKKFLQIQNNPSSARNNET